MKINTSNFSSSLPHKVCIARIRPKHLDLPHLKILAPSVDLLSSYKHGQVSWEQYTHSYWTELAIQCKANPVIWSRAKALVSAGDASDMRSATLIYILQSACKSIGVQEVSLCCYESSNDEHCHRKLIYDALPDYIKGLRK